jgi:hypothetical protein
MRVVSSLVLLLATGAVAVAQTSSFPPSALTNRDKIEWLTTETDAAEHAIDAEAEEPRARQRESVYRIALARLVELARLVGTIPGRLPRLEARVNDTISKAIAGLERIANDRLTIGMTAEQVRQVRGEPSRVSETTTPAGVREEWRYGRTVLSFDGGKLIEIRQMLKGD